MNNIYVLGAYRCRLCEKAILAIQKPSLCPFCGAHDDYVIDAKDWKESKISSLSEISRDNLEKALQIEIENAGFYKCSESSAQDAKNKAIFKILSKIEAEHISIISKLLKKVRTNVGIQNICFRLDYQNIENSITYEKRTKEFYANAYNDAIEPRIKEIFFGLAEIENDHLRLMKSRRQ